MIAIALSAGQGAAAAAMLLGSRFVKRFGEVKSVVILQLLSLPFLLLKAYTRQLWIAASPFYSGRLLMNAGNPIQMSLMMSLAATVLKAGKFHEPDGPLTWGGHSWVRYLPLLSYYWAAIGDMQPYFPLPQEFICWQQPFSLCV
ncbi:hypothetical protein ACN6MY_22495 [Peribacillus sp. B-H-3]|jgi:hypothetical protein|uniref:hypothetical protein n=1 Tax=Peribacillus sp. B-H-3 TaxID=3400420 RepID=UPI003B01F2B0